MDGRWWGFTTGGQEAGLSSHLSISLAISRNGLELRETSLGSALFHA